MAQRPRARALAATAATALAALAAAQSPVPMPTPPSLLLWLRPEELAPGGGACGPANVTLWPNAAPGAGGSLLGYDAAPPVTFSPPARYVDLVSGRCVARFTAASRTLLDVPTLDLQTGAPSYTVTVVARMWNLDGGNRGQIISGAYGSPWVLGWDAGAASLASSNGAWLGGSGGTHEAWGTSEWNMFTLTRDASAGGASTLYRYGNAVRVGALPSGPSALRLGGTTAVFSDCDVAEVIVHGAVLSRSDRIAMEGALAQKYGFAQRLPSAHPFYAQLAPANPPAVSMPAPLAWFRPETLPVDGDVGVWNSSGSAVGIASTFAGSGGGAAPTVIRARFANGTGAPVVRFTAARCTRHVIQSPDLSAAGTSYTVMLVSRMWGDGGRGRTLSSRRYTATDWLLGTWPTRVSTFHTAPAGWIYRGTLAVPQYGSNAWQLYTIRRQAAGTSAFFRNGVSLVAVNASSAFGPNGFFIGGNDGCGSESSDADVAELLVYDYALSDAQLGAATAYVMGRYALDANDAVTPTTTPFPSTLASSSPTAGFSPTASATATATLNRCAVDESFADGALPLAWDGQPAGLVSVVTSAPARGINGATMYDPLSTGSPFAYITTGTGGATYTTLTITVQAQTSRVQVTADVQFDAGSELPFNDSAFVSVTTAGTPLQTRSRVCGVTERTDGVVSLACPAGSVITEIRFASFGTPLLAGCSDGEFEYGSCHNNLTTVIVAAACVGQTVCSVPYSAAAIPCAASAAMPLSLAVVADCSANEPAGTVWSSSVSAVGAYAQSGWRRVTATTQAPGSVRLTFAVRGAGAASLGRVSALAVDNVLVCLVPDAGLSTFSPTPSQSASPVPTPVAPAATFALVPFIASGAAHTCGVTPLNRLLCWGANTAPWDSSITCGQATVPAELVFANVTSTAAGSLHTCAVLSDGRVRCFGCNGAGQTNVPPVLYDGTIPVLALSNGHDFACALTRLGQVQCWGNGANGRLAVPPVLGRGAIAISSGNAGSCGITMYRTVVCWGAIPQPPRISNVRSIYVVPYPASAACAVSDSGTVCWGSAWASIAGNAIAAIAPTQSDVLILTSDGTLFDQTGFHVAARQQVALACSFTHCCGQSTNGTLSCFGDNALGQSMPPLRQPFATPLPRVYPTALGSAPSASQSPAATCLATIGRTAAAPAADCTDYATRSCNKTEGNVWIQPALATEPYQAWCFDGYALAMRLSGTGTMFNYSSGYWTDDALPNVAAARAYTVVDARLLPFTNYPVSALRIRNRLANTSVQFQVPAAVSLTDLFRRLSSDGAVLSALAPPLRSDWVGIAPGACLQNNCNNAALNQQHTWGTFVTGRIGVLFNNENDCATPDTRLFIGSSNGRSVDISCASPDLEIYVRSALIFDTISAPTPSPSLSATPTVGVSASVTASVQSSASGTGSASGTRSLTPSRSGSPPLSGSPTGTLTRAASASATATPSVTPSATATPSVSPYCAESEYAYYPGYDVDYATSLGAALTASERDCARACCDVPRCDAYAFSPWARADAVTANCFFAGNVTGVGRNSLMAAGLRRRVLS